MTSWNNTRPVILPRIQAARELYPDYEVSLVGHSLGGAVAALAGLEMQLKGWNLTVTTFGEPMIGNSEFAKYLDEQFSLNSPYQSTNGIFSAHQFRRVTHVDDPIPLLPLAEWGYAPHGGEIYISKPELPPSIEDMQLCIGNQDPECIAGADTPSSLMDIYQDTNIPASMFGDRLDPCSADRGSDSARAHQAVLGRLRTAEDAEVRCAPDATTALHPRSWNWSLIPARYRLWELFYAHRDYFWRIGLCWPGGDPTG